MREHTKAINNSHMCSSPHPVTFFPLHSLCRDRIRCEKEYRDDDDSLPLRNNKENIKLHRLRLLGAYVSFDVVDRQTFPTRTQSRTNSLDMIWVLGSTLTRRQTFFHLLFNRRDSINNMLRVTVFRRVLQNVAPLVATASSSSSPLQGSSSSLKHDTSLVNLPPGVESCRVFRNVINDYDEELIIEELARIVPKEGQSYYADPTRVNDKILRNIYLELFGFQDFAETKNWRRKKEQQRIPGLVWSPTLVEKIAHGYGRELLGGLVPDGARVVEHHLPGYEMHTEHPSMGRSFLYLNLMSDAIITFDDEATQRKGEAYLPQRSLMVCSGELRWGWRIGEHPQLGRVFRGSDGAVRKRLSEDPEMRLSIQLWKFDPNLVDRRQLQDDLEAAVEEAKVKSATLAAEKEAQLAQKKLDGTEGQEEEKLTFTLPPRLKQQLAEGAMGSPVKAGRAAVGVEQFKAGSLGGDLAAPEKMTKTKKSITDLQNDLTMYRQSMSNVQTLMKDIQGKQNSNEPISTEWLKEQADAVQNKRASELDTDYGFDSSNPEKAWDDVDRKAREYKNKIKGMNYDDDKSREAKSFDLGFDPDVEAPLDIKETLNRLVPHMKDGEKVVRENDFGNMYGRK
ncbi:Hypothetical protein, putative [Bodo saltans]|uniref:Uncharacterized protein n=1 Tax=Bodo saltans TaxID=75058 RepID=A0A0S4JDR9_BODSA|nr:Hypothetical protein, putative [Bodo saltans]|eukprot:CUG89709.1 Hypothetical protein, putative [Bodo saltans]